MAQSTERRHYYIGRIRDSPSQHDGTYTAVRVQFFQLIAALNHFFCLIPQQRPRQPETHFNSQYFTDPGNNNPRHQSENNAIYRQKGNRRNSQRIGKYNHEYTDQNGTIAKRRNIIGQTIQIAFHSQPPHGRIKIWQKPLDGPQEQNYRQYADNPYSPAYCLISHMDTILFLPFAITLKRLP